MNVIKISVGERAQPVVERYEIENSLASVQEQVGGWIQQVQGLGDDYMVICHEEGKMKGLPINFLGTMLTPLFGDDWIVGPVLIVGDDGSPEWTDVPFHLAESLMTVWGAK